MIVYVIHSKLHKYRYVGITKDIEDRLRRHNAGRSKSTAPYRPYKILVKEIFPDRASARQREKFLKSGAGRKWLDGLVS